MFAQDAINKIKRARQEVIESITEVYKADLFGLPPTPTSSGKLEGATPPNMEFITRLYSNEN